MTTCKCWAVTFAGILLLPSIVMGAGPATEAYQKGLSFSDKQDYDAAIAAFSEAIRLSPTWTGAYNNRGVAHERKGDFDKAIADQTEALRLDPKYVQAYYNRGVAYGGKGEHSKSIADFTEALRLERKAKHAYVTRRWRLFAWLFKLLPDFVLAGR